MRTLKIGKDRNYVYQSNIGNKYKLSSIKSIDLLISGINSNNNNNNNKKKKKSFSDAVHVYRY